jgi:FKBP-type peptidyl-prolyl cis-trans isomerase SlyD
VAIKVATDRIVKIAYRITDGAGRVLDEMTPEQGYEYMQGRSQIVPSVERTLEGKTAGFHTEVTCAAREAYGDYNPALVAEVPRSRLPKGADVKVGMKFNTTGPTGQTLTVRVIEIEDENVTVDGNHPLAGLELIFEVRVLDVREANEHELEAGRPHGAVVNPRSGIVH